MKRSFLIICYALLFTHVFAQYEPIEPQSQFAEQKKVVLNEANEIKVLLLSVKTEHILDSIIYYQYPTEDDSILYSKTEYDYIGDTETHKIEYLWDDISGLWVNFQKRIWIFDENGNLLEYHRINWDLVSGSWVNQIKFVFEYNLAGQETLYIYYKWDEALEDWIYFIKADYDYDSYGNMILQWAWEWDESMNNWMGDQYLEMYYSTTNKLIERIFYTWDTTIYNWDEYSKSELEYDNNDYLVLRKDYGWSMLLNDWSSNLKNEYINTASGNPELILYYFSIDNGVSWEYSNKTEKTYNSDELEILDIYYSWEENTMEWLYLSKHEFEWDEFEHRILDKRHHWDNTLNDWQVGFMIQQSFYTNETIESNAWYAYDSSLELLIGDYKIYYFVNDDFKYTIKNEYVWDLSSSDWILDTKGYYHYTVMANISDQRESDFELFPNPVHNELTLLIGNNDPVNYSVYSVNGALLLNGSINEQGKRINVASLPKGVYIVTINNGKETFSQQLVKK